MTKKSVKLCFFATIKRCKLLAFSVIVFVVGSVIFAILPPLALESAVNSLAKGEQLGLKIALVYFVLLALVGVCDAVRGVLITKLGQKITTTLRQEMSEKLSRLPNSYFVNTESGKIVARFISDVDAIESLFKSGIINMTVDLMKIISIFIVIFTKSVGLGIVVLLVTPIVFGISIFFKNRMRVSQLKNRSAIAKMNNHIVETMHNMTSAHTLKKEQYLNELFNNYVDESFSALRQSNFFESLYTPIISQIKVLIVAAVMILASLSGNVQQFFGIGVGTSVAIISYINNIFSPIENLGMEIQNIQSALAGVFRVNDFLNENEIVQPIISDFQQFDFNAPAVEFNDVVFGYDEQIVLNGINFSIKSGENVAFVGRTGAGKSTVYRLVMGLFKPNSGSVKIFGIDSHLIPDKLKRKIFGYIEQSTRIIDGSVKDQITLGDNDYNDEEVLATLKRVGLDEVVNHFDNGINTKCESGLFSIGQLQLLAVCRALIGNPKILLLDEITANLDSETEKKVALTIKQEQLTKTIVSISHRMGDISSDARIIQINSKH